MKYASVIISFILVVLSGATIIFVPNANIKVLAGIFGGVCTLALFTYLDNLQHLLKK